MKVKELLENPYKCTIRKLAFYTRKQEDYNYVIKKYYEQLDHAIKTKNESSMEMSKREIKLYLECLTGYKEKFIINV